MRELKKRFLGASELEWRGIFPKAPLRHIESNARIATRDRFGNRVFTSADRAYSDRENKTTKAALLVSEHGQALIRQHNGILGDISRGLEILAPKRAADFLTLPEEPIVIGLKENRRSLQFIGTGHQSVVFRLAAGDEHYAIKVHRPETGIHQPYVNEMLQIQTLAKECADALIGLHIDLPTFLFASGQVSCTEFIPHPARLDQSSPATHHALAETFQAFIRQQKEQGIDLWKNMSVDILHRGKLPISNYRMRDDGSIVWVDPLVYVPHKDSVEAGRLGGRSIVTPPDFTWREFRDHYIVAQKELADLQILMRQLESVDVATWLKGAKDFFDRYAISLSIDPEGDSIESQAYSAADLVKRIIFQEHRIRRMMEREGEDGASDG